MFDVVNVGLQRVLHDVVKIPTGPRAVTSNFGAGVDLISKIDGISRRLALIIVKGDLFVQINNNITNNINITKNFNLNKVKDPYPTPTPQPEQSIEDLEKT